MLPRGKEANWKIKYLLPRGDCGIQYSYIGDQNPSAAYSTNNSFPICCIFYKQLFLRYIFYLQIQKFVDFLSYMRHKPSWFPSDGPGCKTTKRKRKDQLTVSSHLK